ncbi:hypothetical protein BKK54_04265 [Rodentibacter genomosp. 1]|uniref:Enoyl-CoA hydratase n=1 Tax=Rodentibacter genomosp. 1 TaxID=1908264 RepID=A0A1V3J6N2_9PAST|nr:hypothetical protein [Rodentibacter genomosp. 1]OOF50917.1 hypothetical protein BKK54_04265 [Rodentibacter genomosp. 1]
MSKVYLAMYKAKGNWVDKVIRLFTGKPYSHCELAVANGDKYLCYSSSPRDGGVRVKTMRLPTDKWDLIPVHTDSDIVDFFQRTGGKKYDFIGAIGCVLPVRQKASRYYCSEWCYEAIWGVAPKKALSPNKLAELIKGGFTSHKV